MAGHHVTVYEASNHLGGRILTHRIPNKGFITELGAMRLPLKQHPLTNIYVKERYKLKVTPFVGYDSNALFYINGHRRTFNERIVPEENGFNVYEREKNKTVSDLWNDAMKSVTYTSYDDLKAKYDKYSIEGYFLEHENMSRGAIDFISLMYNVDMQTSLIEMVRSTVILTLNPEYTQIDGGFNLLTDEFERNCKNVPNGRCNIYTNTRVKEVHYMENPNNSSIRPWVRLVIGENSTAIRFDSVIVSTTARAASLIEFEPRSLFVDKYRAWRQLHYDCATKIAHSFSRSFWRDENIQGGYSITDLPIRAQQIPDQSRMHITTDRGSLTAEKIIFLPGAFTKTMMSTLGLNLSINLYELPSAVHFYRSQSSSNLTVSTWSFTSTNSDHYAGFPQDQSNYLRIEPRINPTTMQTINSPLDLTNKPDQQILDRMLTWIGQHLSQTVDLTNPIMPTDTMLDSMLSDKGFILDYIPGFEQKLVLGTDSWSSIQYMPAFAEILARLVLTNGSSTCKINNDRFAKLDENNNDNQH
ncbi:unnamed protein product [Rotaria sordida]|uniref:Amine oxidase domain-containing protein n=1 Tax=Rotaria sordida TaxID=392033 RepID=A0A814RE77_9BILA|nr:unnamed protein product [Rotaria sordida]